MALIPAGDRTRWVGIYLRHYVLVSGELVIISAVPRGRHTVLLYVQVDGDRQPAQSIDTRYDGDAATWTKSYEREDRRWERGAL